MPRFKDGALEANLELVARVKELATKKGVTPGQLALAWVHAQVGGAPACMCGQPVSPHLQ